MNDPKTDANEGIRHNLAPLLILTSIFFINFIARVVLAPLMPTIETELGLTHAQAGSLFMLQSFGYLVTLLGSGFVSSRLTHKRTIMLSSTVLGAALIATSAGIGVWGLRLGLIAVGMAAGLYFPSGLATLTSLISLRNWGKALAIHDLAPNLSFVLAPLVAEAVMMRFSWRAVFFVLGLAAFFLAIIFGRYGRGGEFQGEPPRPAALKTILSQNSFWVMVLMFCLGISSSIGIYTMLPLFLVNEHGLERNWANTLLALSRVVATGMTFIGGWAADRFGVHRVLIIVFILTGSMTILLGLVPKEWVGVPIFLQPMVAVCFFPAALAALSMVSPPKLRNIFISLNGSISFFIGGGAVPALIGFIGDRYSFSAGITLTGALIVCGAILPRFLKLYNQEESSV